LFAAEIWLESEEGREEEEEEEVGAVHAFSLCTFTVFSN
jgi:hypothetical protein